MIAILTAMDKELYQLQNLLDSLHAWDRFMLIKCGIGKVNAAMTVTELIINHDISGIISSGCAGGNNQFVNLGDVVVCSETAYHDVFCGAEAQEWDFLNLPPRMQADATLLAAAKGGDVKPGLICTGDQFITTVKDMDRIRNRFPDVMAVDMETAAIAHVCHKYDTPFTSIRVISDTPGVEAHFEQYTNFWDTMAERSFQTMKGFIANLL
ncbi:MAG TPA: 5'-methylthioadenosine/S-adenosylhomocysteine nucleosidase [Bacteroidales bacterium]|nr:5'-methylthioadenosine/S-adenosylhomocysteine nucleosidase [Bacteroidales bacterium]